MNAQESSLPRESTSAGANPEAPSRDTHRSTTQRVAGSAHETIDSAAAKAEEIEAHLRAGAAKAGSKIGASQAAATAQAEKSLSALQSFVKERPVAAVGIAFVAGVLATAMLRR